MCLHECWKEVHVCLMNILSRHPVIEWDKPVQMLWFFSCICSFQQRRSILKKQHHHHSLCQRMMYLVDCNQSHQNCLMMVNCIILQSEQFFQHTESNVNMNKKYLKDLIKIFLWSFLKQGGQCSSTVNHFLIIFQTLPELYVLKRKYSTEFRHHFIWLLQMETWN